MYDNMYHKYVSRVTYIILSITFIYLQMYNACNMRKHERLSLGLCKSSIKEYFNP